MLVVVLVLVVVVLVVVVDMVACWWDGCHVAHGDVAPAFDVRERRGRGDGKTYLTLWTVTMACIVTIWTTWHLATSSPARSIARHALSRWGGDVASPPRGWYRVSSL